MLRRIVLIVNENLYQSKHYFTYKFAEALRREGISVLIIDTEKGGKLDLDQLGRLYRQAPDLTCSFNTILPLADGKFLWDALEIPHLSILVDPAIFSLNLAKSPYSVISCVDHFDCDIVQRANFRNVFFFPHAIEREFTELPLEKERPYDVVLLGSCYDHESLRSLWQKQYPKHICDAIEDAIERVLNEPRTTVVQAVLKVWNERSLDPKEVDFIPIFTYIDNYARGKDRYDLLRSLKGFDVHVFGSLFWEEGSQMQGWEHYLRKEKHITLHPAVPYEEALGIMRKSKICLNSTPFFKNGSHERLFAGLAAGCTLVASENLFVRENFSEEKGVFVYQHQNLEAVSNVISTLLSHEEDRIAAVLKGRDIVSAHHTWDQRARQLIKEMPVIFGRIYANNSNPN